MEYHTVGGGINHHNYIIAHRSGIVWPPMLPSSASPAASKRPRPDLCVARLQLHALRGARERPLSCIVTAVGAVILLLTPLLRCNRCSTSSSGHDAEDKKSARLAADEHFMEPEVITAVSPTGDSLRMAHVVVGIMTCRRFHRTRCRAQVETWLTRARRVVFFSDSADGASAELRAPVLAHTFAPSPTERIFSGGNWRAVPILRSLGEAFFSEEARAAMAARSEPLPRWVYMADDDTYAFTPTMLATLSEYDPDMPHYLGYAFIAAPHLEGIVPGVRQPLFANGGAGIAVSRGAFSAALPLFAKCEAEYKWNWPGDVRVAQCLLDAGVAVEWIRTFHAEAPGIIIHKQRPPPGSVPVGLQLPPLSFHHIDADALHLLSRMQAVSTTVSGLPCELDFSAHAFQPLTATHPSSRLQLSMHYGYEVVLSPQQGTDRPIQLLRPTKAGEYLAAFRTYGAVRANGSTQNASLASGFMQEFTGGECREGGQLRGGYSAQVLTHCGKCAEAEDWAAPAARSGLQICNFTFSHCTARIHVALEPAHCPRPSPRARIGLDAGRQPGSADVLLDGLVRPGWRGACGGDAGDGNPSDSSALCTTVSIRPGSDANLTLWFRVLAGSAVVQAARPQVVAHGSRRAVHVDFASSPGTLLLSGTVPVNAEMATDVQGKALAAALEPHALPLTIHQSCGADTAGVHGVRLKLRVLEHVAVEIGWRVRCA